MPQIDRDVAVTVNPANRTITVRNKTLQDQGASLIIWSDGTLQLGPLAEPIRPKETADHAAD